MKRNMPADWTPPYPSWSADFGADGGDSCFDYFGVQQADGHDGADAWARLQECLRAEDAPDLVLPSRYTDAAGRVNRVATAYWRDPARRSRWENAEPFRRFWFDPRWLQGDAGLWREAHRVPLARAETLASSMRADGFARLAAGMHGPVREHGYWGSARDRLPIGGSDPLDPAQAALQPPLRQAARGRRLRVTSPANICLIRSAQDWSACGPAERETYLDMVHPSLLAGMDFLRDNPVETGCLSCRFMVETDEGGQWQDRTFGALHFLSLAHMERWARNHPTHMAIFARFHEMAKRHAFALDLALWHEVFVLEEGGIVADYVNCHDDTGLLPFCTAVAMGT